MTRSILPFILVAIGAGCSRPEAEVLHTLRPLQLDAGTPAPASAFALEVMPLRLPEAIQRPQLVTASGTGTLGLLENHRWGNGLEQDMQRVLVQNLSALLNSEAVVAFPDGPRVRAAHRLEVDVQRCEGRPGGMLTLQATWMVAPPQGGQALIRKRVSLEEPVQGLDAEALVAAHSRALARLSREIAAGLAGLAVAEKADRR